VEPVPRSGVVGPGQKGVVKLHVCPGVPAHLSETIGVEIAHFEPIAVQLLMEGVYTSCSVSLPRWVLLPPDLARGGKEKRRGEMKGKAGSWGAQASAFAHNTRKGMPPHLPLLLSSLPPDS
jgi:hypothetical protein